MFALAEFGSNDYSMRNLFVMDVERPLSVSIRTLSVQFRICPIRSMIDPRLHRKRVSSVYPLNSQDLPSISSVLRLYHHTQRLRLQIQRHFDNFQPLNFYEYILYCRVEYFSRTDIEKSTGTCSDVISIGQSLKSLAL